MIIRNKSKGLGQGFRNNKKIAQEIGTKLKDQDRDLGGSDTVLGTGTIRGTLAI